MGKSHRVTLMTFIALACVRKITWLESESHEPLDLSSIKLCISNRLIFILYRLYC